MGRTTAPYFGGFQNSVQYKHITLSANITYAFGHIFRRQSVNNYPQYKGTFSGVIGAQKDLALRWKNPGDESTTDVPGLVAINYNSYSRYQYADILVESASNIKLRQIALTYSVPSALLQKTIFKSLNAGISVRNLGMNKYIKQIILTVSIVFASAITSEAQVNPKEKFDAFLQALHKNYVDTVDDDELVDVAIKAMLKELDPHSKYYSRPQYGTKKQSMSGVFTGIGIEYSMQNDTACSGAHQIYR